MLPLEFGFVGSPLLKKEAINNYKRSLVDTPENQNLTIRLQISLPFSLRLFYHHIRYFHIFLAFQSISQTWQAVVLVSSSCTSYNTPRAWRWWYVFTIGNIYFPWTLFSNRNYIFLIFKFLWTFEGTSLSFSFRDWETVSRTCDSIHTFKACNSSSSNKASSVWFCCLRFVC